MVCLEARNVFDRFDDIHLTLFALRFWLRIFTTPHSLGPVESARASLNGVLSADPALRVTAQLHFTQHDDWMQLLTGPQDTVTTVVAIATANLEVG
jgi:hypothetical protein